MFSDAIFSTFFKENGSKFMKIVINPDYKEKGCLIK
jgi:hypothetical protein